MSSSPIILTPPSAAKVPITEKQEIRALTHLFSLVNRYQLGDEARLDTVDGAKGLSRKVKAVIGRNAVTATGQVSERWSRVGAHDRWTMVKALNSSAPWLEKFTNHWLSEWVLAKGVNQRVTDMNRASYKRREEKRRTLVSNGTFFFRL
jgi:hypothetical protein